MTEMEVTFLIILTRQFLVTKHWGISQEEFTSLDYDSRGLLSRYLENVGSLVDSSLNLG